MTDFITVTTTGQSAVAFANWWSGTVPDPVPAGDRYILEIGTQELNEYPDFTATGKVIDGVVIIRPVSGEGHTGIRGTGRKIQRNGAANTNIFVMDGITGTGGVNTGGQIIIEDMEIQHAPASNNIGNIVDPGGTTLVAIILRRCLITNSNTGNTRALNYTGGAGVQVVSSRIWLEGAAAAMRVASGFINSVNVADWIFQGNIIQCDTAVQRGIDLSFGANSPAGANLDVQGNMIFGSTQDYQVSGVGLGTVTEAANVTEDLTGQVTGAVVVNDIVSVNNPDVKAGSIALEVWTAKPTTYGAEIDIYGNDRSAVAETAEWDAGSMQLSNTPAAGGTTLRRAAGSFASGTGIVGSTVFVPIPFEAKALKLAYSGARTVADGVNDNPVNIGMGVAFVDPTTMPVITQGAMATVWDDNTVGAPAYRRVNRANCMVRVNNAGANSGALALQSVSISGMTFVVTEAFPFTVQILFEALGGSAIEAGAVVEFDHAGTTGVQQVGGLNFQPNYGLLAHAFLNIGGGNDNASQANGLVGMGVADGVNSWAMASSMAHALNPTQAFKYFRTDQWLATIDAAGAVGNRSIWSAWNADGFDIDHIVASGAVMTIIGLMLKVSAVEVGTLLTKTDGSDIVTSVGFDSKASFFGSCGAAENVLDVSAADAQLIFGFSTAPSEQLTQGAASVDDVSQSLVPVAQDNAALFIKSENAFAVAALMSLIGTTVDDFTTVMGVPEPSAASIVGFVILGDDDPPDEQVDPIGSELLDLADTEDVDERHPLALVLDPVDSSALQQIASGFPVIQGTEQGITLGVLSDPEEDTLFPILSSQVDPIFLIEGVGDISISPLGSALLQIDSENDLSLSILETDHETFVLGTGIPTIQGDGVPTFLVQPTGVALNPQGSTLGAKTGGLVDPMTSGVPNITVSRPTDPEDNISFPPTIRDVVIDNIRSVVLNF